MSLKDVRKEAGLSQSKLAEASGVNIRMIQQYEQETKNINGAKLHTLANIAIALDAPISDILTDEELIETLKKTTL